MSPVGKSPNLKPEDLYDLGTHRLPVPFDIVWCHFPYKDDGFAAGPVARPCLVRQTWIQDVTIGGALYKVGWLDVVYGTKQIDKFPEPQGFHVYDPGEMNHCGLIYETVFNLMDHLKLPWSPVYFGSKQNKTPNQFHFTEDMKKRLKVQASRL